jgi:DNA-binding response OmpR family regulator
VLGLAFVRERRRVTRDRLHLLRTLTHELRTPAMALGLDIEPLRASYDELPIHLQEPLLRLSGGIARLHRVLQHSARTLELFEGKGKLASPVTIESTHEMLKDLAAEWPEEVTLTCEGDDGAIATDPEWLAVALRNLVDNACKHGTSPVVVRAKLERDALVVRVEDAGTTSEMSFRHATAAWTRSKASGGLGLGLALVARVANALARATAHRVRATDPAEGGRVTRRVLVVEDDAVVAAALHALLAGEGYAPTVAGSIAEARAAGAADFDVVLLDWRLPDGEGIDFLKELRKTSDVPVLMVTARVDVIDRVLGLELGADDYVTKPVEPRELLARIKARLRRPGKEAAPEAERVIEAHEIRVDLDAREVTFRGQPVTLTKMELELLVLLLKNPGRVFSREELLNQVWGFERAPTTRTVDTHVAVLRSKLVPELFESVRGIGYRLVRDARDFAAGAR